MKKGLLSRILSAGMAVCMLVALGSQSVLTAGAASTEELARKFEARRFINNDKYPRKMLPYRIYVPENYDETKSYPLVLSLHGSGERGSDNFKHLNYANTLPLKLVEEENLKKYPCIIVVPQCADGDWWVWNYYQESTFSMDMTVDLIHSLVKEYNIDQNRMYVTGYSMGGTGTWDLLVKHPEMWAAAVPICGVTDPYVWNHADNFKDIPIQLYHASGDQVVDVENSRAAYFFLSNAGVDIEYHEVSGDHGAGWAAAFNDSKLLPWLFSQKNDNTFPPFVPPEKEDPDDTSSKDPDNTSSDEKDPDGTSSDEKDPDDTSSDKKDPDNSSSNIKDPDKEEPNGTSSKTPDVEQEPSDVEEPSSSDDSSSEDSSPASWSEPDSDVPKTGEVGALSGIKVLFAMGAITALAVGGYTYLTCKKKKSQ